MNKEDYNKYYIQGSDHYLIPKDVFKELFNEMINWREETKELKKQLEYLRSGEYYNQLRFERDMLQDLVDKKEISKEDKEFIDMTHRNTELLEELEEEKRINVEDLKTIDRQQEIIQELKKQLEEKDILIKQYELSVSNVMDCYCERTDCSGRIKDSKQYDSLVQKVENQQQEFIEYITSYIELLNNKPDLIEENQKDILEEILSNYKEIIGVSNENN